MQDRGGHNSQPTNGLVAGLHRILVPLAFRTAISAERGRSNVCSKMLILLVEPSGIEPLTS